MDVMTRKQRSYCMSRIRGKHTKPELIIRKLLREKGMRKFRLHANLPGKPDLYFPDYRFAVFIDGCFWHRCPYCRLTPETRKRFWKMKLESNVSRDRKNNRLLWKKGIRLLHIREHRVRKDPNSCIEAITDAMFSLPLFHKRNEL